jgi:hypothetical protein
MVGMERHDDVGTPHGTAECTYRMRHNRLSGKQ